MNTKTKVDSPRENLAAVGKGLPPFFYRLVQAFLTWMTGKPYPGQQPLFRSSKEWELTTAIACLVGGVIVSSSICYASSPFLFPLLIPSWLVTTGSARKMLTCLMHRCVHRQFYGDNRDRILAEILSTFILLQGFDGYRHDHVKCHHNADKFATWKGDPDANFVLVLGFRPGLK
jgi:fatty acid desaturase